MALERIERLAPAKINLFLYVTERRDDGYHELDTLFIPLELADRLSLQLDPTAPETRVECRCPGHAHLDGPENLAAHAARRYLEAGDLRCALSVTIHKRIWSAAGLGGGSSDAAATLLALQQRFSAIDDATLAEIALSLGADVPFFLRPTPCRGRGVGDRLTPLPDLPRLDFVLVNPGRPLSTAAVFGRLNLDPDRASPPRTLDFSAGAASAAAMIHNDLSAAAAALEPQIADIKNVLIDAGALGAGLSGSGPTVFGIFEDGATTARLAAQLVTNKGLCAIASRSAPPLTR